MKPLLPCHALHIDCDSGAEEEVQALEGGEVICPNPPFDMTGRGITFTIDSGLPSGESPTGDPGLIFGGGG